MSFPGRFVQRTWHLVDAADQTVGRIATQVAPILRGKHKPTYRPNADCGDFVVIVNADKVNFTGRKWQDKLYRWHSGYPGGLKERPAHDMHRRKPTYVLRKAIFGMLYNTTLRNKFIRGRLKVYPGPDHPHGPQLGPDVMPLPRHPRSRREFGDFHFGLGGTYSSAPVQGNEGEHTNRRPSIPRTKSVG